MRVFAFGDVHGRPRTLRKLFEAAGVRNCDKVIGLGDYFDRGPDTKGVLTYLNRRRDRGHDLSCLVGNHDGFWIAAYEMYNILPKGMLRYGGPRAFSDVREWRDSKSKIATMLSYGMDTEHLNPRDLSRFPDPHVDFMCMLESHIDLTIDGKRYLFVHAGLPESALSLPSVDEALKWTLEHLPYEMIWGKTGLGSKPCFNDATIVHGHIPWKFVDEIVNGKPENRRDKPVSFSFPGVNFGRINLDASVGLDGKPYLAGMWLPGEEIVMVSGDD